MHVHEEEQIVLVIEGEFEFDIDGEVRTMRAGDVAVIPSWVRHGARTRGVACREVDVFNPPRRSLLEHAQRQAPPPTLQVRSWTSTLAAAAPSSPVAAKGIGLAVAYELIAEGARVAICSRNADGARPDRGDQLGHGVFARATDVTPTPTRSPPFVDEAAEALGGLDVLVNNAGGAHPGDFESPERGGLARRSRREAVQPDAVLPGPRCRICGPSQAPRVVNVNAVYAK